MDDIVNALATPTRTPILIDFSKFDGVHTNDRSYDYISNWKVVPLDKANGWSSQCRYTPEVHLPVFDVDMDPELLMMLKPRSNPGFEMGDVRWVSHDRPAWTPTTGGVVDLSLYRKAFLWEILEEHFPGANIDWVSSTTPGHHHVYMDDFPLLWSEYVDSLRWLTLNNIIEPGYFKASVREGSTHVRMPHIKKQQHYPPPLPEWPKVSYPYKSDPF